MTFYIGLMSGTSLDGVDGVLAAFEPRPMRMAAHAHRPFPEALRAELLALNTSGGDELHRAALASNALARIYAEVVDALLKTAATERRAIRAIGAHGQTVRHRPGAFDGVGYTLQLNAPALLAELSGIDVVADFRSRDLAAGGIGAPLVPAFHRAVFGKPGTSTAVLNLGGMSNLTVLHADGRTSGFDCGPGNSLLDHWILAHRGQAFDAGGAWAATGSVEPALLASLLTEPYFTQVPPKSTGRDFFHADWLRDRLVPFGALPSADVQSTLAELTARVCAADVSRHAPSSRELLVCGGGALNGDLLRRLAAHLPGVLVQPTDRVGLPCQQVEASAFAWLAQCHVEGRAGNLPAVTGARGPRLLGALYPSGISSAA